MRQIEWPSNQRKLPDAAMRLTCAIQRSLRDDNNETDRDALAKLGLIDEYEFVVQPRIAGHGPTLFAGLARHVDLKLVDRQESSSVAVAMRYEPRR